jgi:hypothetical protein
MYVCVSRHDLSSWCRVVTSSCGRQVAAAVRLRCGLPGWLDFAIRAAEAQPGLAVFDAEGIEVALTPPAPPGEAPVRVLLSKRARVEHLARDQWSCL